MSFTYKDEVNSPNTTMDSINSSPNLNQIIDKNQDFNCPVNHMFNISNFNNNGNNSNSQLTHSQPQKPPLDLNTKIKIIEECSRNTQTKVAELFSVHRTTVSKILKEKDHLLHLYKSFRINKIQNGLKKENFFMNKIIN